jgi:type IV pilus assembly protein PilP
MMRRNLVIIRNLISIICIVLLLWGCERSTAVTAKPIVVRKKVVDRKDNIAKTHKKKKVRIADKLETADTQAKKATTVTAETIQVAAKSQSKKPEEIQKQPLMAKEMAEGATTKIESKTLTLKKPALKPKSDISEIRQPPEIKKPVTVETESPGRKIIAASAENTPAGVQTGAPATYDPAGKTDPFEPLFKEKPVSVKKRERKKRIPRTPLERIDLSQLKLVAIVLSSSGNMALVEEASGKGYVIKKGTYVGTNAGKVVKINKEKVIVEEEFEDVFGNVKIRERDIKLPKPPGEF